MKVKTRRRETAKNLRDKIKYVYMNDIIATYVTHRNTMTSIYQCMLQGVSYLSPAFI